MPTPTVQRQRDPPRPNPDLEKTPHPYARGPRLHAACAGFDPRGVLDQVGDPLAHLDRQSARLVVVLGGAVEGDGGGAWRRRRGDRAPPGSLATAGETGSLAGVMEPQDVCLKVLTDAAPEALHWTVVLDRALKDRLLDPFTIRDVRGTVVKSLAALAREGRVVKQSTGVYRMPNGA